MIKDPYKVLCISRDASEEEIKKSYRSLVKKYHPDLNPGDEKASKRMNEINEAYEFLMKNRSNTNEQSTMDVDQEYSGNSQSAYYKKEPFRVYKSHKDWRRAAYKKKWQKNIKRFNQKKVSGRLPDTIKNLFKFLLFMAVMLWLLRRFIDFDALWRLMYSYFYLFNI